MKCESGMLSVTLHVRNMAKSKEWSNNLREEIITLHKLGTGSLCSSTLYLFDKNTVNNSNIDKYCEKCETVFCFYIFKM